MLGPMIINSLGIEQVVRVDMGYVAEIDRNRGLVRAIRHIVGKRLDMRSSRFAGPRSFLELARKFSGDGLQDSLDRQVGCLCKCHEPVFVTRGNLEHEVDRGLS